LTEAEGASDDEGPDRREVAARVEAEARPRAAEPRRKELGEVEAERADDSERHRPAWEEKRDARLDRPVDAERRPYRECGTDEIQREQWAASESRDRNGRDRTEE